MLRLSEAWQLKGPPWFRGQLESKTSGPPLLPKVYHRQYAGRENELVQVFRMRAQRYGPTPEFSRIDQWLFLMQHTGLPTRLLDWTEGALIALYFAVNRYDARSRLQPVVWLMNPLALNLLAMGVPGFSLTWLGYRHETPVPVPHIVAAFQNDESAQPAYPVAVYPQPVHPRMTAQRGTFSIHGLDKRSIDRILGDIDPKLADRVIRAGLAALTPKGKRDLVNPDATTVIHEFLRGDYLVRVGITCRDREAFLRQLRSLGVSQSTLFPEMDGLADELKHLRTEIF